MASRAVPDDRGGARRDVRQSRVALGRRAPPREAPPRLSRRPRRALARPARVPAGRARDGRGRRDDGRRPLGAQPAALGLMRHGSTRTEGRRLFGATPRRTSSRTPRPRGCACTRSWSERCGLGPGASVARGRCRNRPGDPAAARARSADPLVVARARPCARGAICADVYGRARRDLVAATLEEAELEPATFDLAAAASSFHWVDERVGLARIHAALRPGGWIALWWTLFGDGGRADPFIARDSRRSSTASTLSPSKGEEDRAAASHSDARTPGRAHSDAAGFVDVEHELVASGSADLGHARAFARLYGSVLADPRVSRARRRE